MTITHFDDELIRQAFRLIYSNDPETINMGFEMLYLKWDIIKHNERYYNKLVKQYLRLPSRNKSIEVLDVYISFIERFIRPLTMSQYYKRSYFDQYHHRFKRYFEKENEIKPI